MAGRLRVPPPPPLHGPCPAAGTHLALEALGSLLEATQLAVAVGRTLGQEQQNVSLDVPSKNLRGRLHHKQVTSSATDVGDALNGPNATDARTTTGNERGPGAPHAGPAEPYLLGELDDQRQLVVLDEGQQLLFGDLPLKVVPAFVKLGTERGPEPWGTRQSRRAPSSPAQDPGQRPCSPVFLSGVQRQASRPHMPLSINHSRGGLQESAPFQARPQGRSMGSPEAQVGRAASHVPEPPQLVTPGPRGVDQQAPHGMSAPHYNARDPSSFQSP